MPDQPIDQQSTKPSLSTPIEPVQVTIIGTGDGGNAAPLQSGTVGVTADHMPNIVVTVIQPIAAVLVRSINFYIWMVVGLLGTAMTSDVITAPDFGHLLLKCMGMAVGGTVVVTLKNIATIFTGLEKKFPLATGSV